MLDLPRMVYHLAKANQLNSKVVIIIIITVIWLLDDLTYFARSAVADLGIWTKLYECLWHHSTASQCGLKCPQLTYLLLPFGLNLKWRFSDPSLEGLDDNCPSAARP